MYGFGNCVGISLQRAYFMLILKSIFYVHFFSSNAAISEVTQGRREGVETVIA